MRFRLNLAAFGTGLAILFGSVGIASGQPNPADMRSGSISGQGYGSVAVLTVPGDQYFVLTDLQWGPGDPVPVNFTAYAFIQGSSANWQATAFQTSTDHAWPVGFHLTTGFKFDPGETVTIGASASPSGFYWKVTWSGYLVPAGLSGIQSPSGEQGDNSLRIRPNPAGGMARIDINLRAAGAVRANVFDVSGRRIRALYEGELPAGAQTLTWDGENDDGNPVADGVYFTRLETATGSESRVITLVR
jgi:hypothetical protein